MQLSGYSFDQYQLTRRLRRGGMGDIYRARDMKLGRSVAIKVVRTDTIDYADEEEARETARLFLRETQVVAKLDHRHILPLYDANEVHIDGMTLLYMVMPLREEGSLTDWLHQYSGGAENVTLLPQHTARIIRQAADALQYAHDREIVHKDIKPSNFLVRDHALQPGKLYLQLADFGVAKLMNTSNHSLIIRGTPTYMAPEQWEGQTLPASDQYSLAIMAYELLTGQVPFEGDNQQLWHQHFNMAPSPPGAINPDVPVELDDVVLRALAKTPEERFDSISTFANAFRRAVIDADNRVQRTQPLATYGVEAMPTAQLPHMTEKLAEDGPEYLPPRRGSIRLRAVALAVLALMLIGASLIAVSLFSSYAPDSSFNLPQPTDTTTHASPTANLTATQQRYATTTAQASETGSAQTATVNNNAAAITATARAQASATVSVRASATALAESQATATVGAYNKTAVAGTPSFDDFFQDSADSLNWDTTYSTTYGGCEFTNGGYLASVPQSSSGTFSSCYAEATQYSNFFYEVHLSIVKGDQGGILFRGDSQNLFFYAFFIDTNGKYELDTYLHNSLSAKVVSGQSGYINTEPHAINILSVLAQGNTFTLFVNKHQLTTVTDNTFSAGQVGVISAVESNPTDVIFSEAKLSTP